MGGALRGSGGRSERARASQEEVQERQGRCVRGFAWTTTFEQEAWFCECLRFVPKLWNYVAFPLAGLLPSFRARNSPQTLSSFTF